MSADEIEEFRKWIHSFSSSRVFVHDKVDMLLDAWLTAVKNGHEWLHFNLDWEDGYIRRHDQLFKEH